MKLIFLGSGSAFTVGTNNYQSNMILESPQGHRLLIDCGSDARHSMHEQGLTYKDIQDVYISHLHADHVGGLEWLAFQTKFDPFCQKIRLHLSEQLVEPLWDHVLSGSLCCLEGSSPKLSTFFEVDPIPHNGYFLWQKVKCQIVQTIHTICGYSLVPSFGLLLDINGFIVFITTDTQLAPNQIQDLYRKAHLIFQDCETSAHRSGVHAHYQELVKLEPEIKEKMWLYHYSDDPLPNAKKEGFKGFVQKGQSFHLSLNHDES
jgi:ribonuclease BN (tRNA processing enzyme)